MTSTEFSIARATDLPSRLAFAVGFQPELAARLADVLEATGAEVVLSSDWRRGRELDHLRDELNAAGIRCASRLPPRCSVERAARIEAWMSEHGFDLDSVVIVDDGYDMDRSRGLCERAP